MTTYNKDDGDSSAADAYIADAITTDGTTAVDGNTVSVTAADS